MEKFLLSLLCLLTVGFAGKAETVSFSNGLPSDWTKLSGTVAKQNRENKDCIQLQKNTSITSPKYVNVEEIIVELNISSKATTLKIEQSLDNQNWTELKTIAKADCSTSTWKAFTIATVGDTSNGVYFKLTSAAASYYISTFDYTVATVAPVDPTTCATPVAKIGETVLANNGKAYVNDVLTLSCATEGGVNYLHSSWRWS